MAIDSIQQKCCLNDSCCQPLNSNESIVLSDPETKKKNKAKVKVIASSKTYIIMADGGIFPKNQGNKRADYMAYTDKNLYIIELKGKVGIESAYEQILSTINTIVHSDDFNFLIQNRNKTMACIAGQVRIPKGGSRKEMELAKKLVKHSKERQKNIINLIVYSYKNNHSLFLE